ncbi:MAG TPA: flippase [Bryobacteraceae bacterium]|nr:flippase [Bryobacteraceae bacterium]
MARAPRSAELGPAGSTVVRNFASLLIGRMGSQALSFLTNAYLARRIAPAGFGAVGLAQSIISYLGLLSDSGLSVIALREGAQDPSRLDDLIRSITGLRLALSCALVPVGLLAAHFLPFSESSLNVLRVFSLSLPLQALAVDWVFRALQRMHYAAITQLATAALTLLLTVAFVHTPRHLQRVPWLSVATGAAALALSLYLLGRTGHRLSIRFQFKRSKRYLAQSLPLCAASFAITLYIQANFLILGKVHGDTEVGLYAAAFKVAAFVFTITSLYFSAMAPALMELAARSGRDAARLLTESVRVTAAGACGLVAIGAAGSGFILRWVFGAPFLPATNALAILLCSGGVVAVTSNWGQLAIASHRERLVLWATALGGCVNLIVCAALVRRYGSLGAAIGNLAAEIVVGVVVIAPWPSEVGLGTLRASLKPAVVAAIALCLGSRLAPLGGLWAASAVACLYLAGLWATRTVTSNDISRVWSALRVPGSAQP